MPEPGFAPWLRFAPDGRLTVLSYVVEMGQGTHTALVQIVAEELSPPLSFREIGGVCSAARSLLLQAAATVWGLAPEACRTEEGQVWHPDGQQRLGFSQLLAAAARLTPPKDAELKRRPRAELRTMGRSTARSDIPAKVDGSAPSCQAWMSAPPRRWPACAKWSSCPAHWRWWRAAIGRPKKACGHSNPNGRPARTRTPIRSRSAPSCALRPWPARASPSIRRMTRSSTMPPWHSPWRKPGKRWTFSTRCLSSRTPRWSR